MRIKKIGAITVLVLALGLGACGSTAAKQGNGTAESAQSGVASAVQGSMPEVEGGFGEKPVIHPASGAEPTELVSKVLVKGDGAEVKTTDTLTVNYAGQLWDGKPFDSSFDRGKPSQFPLSGVIPGWTQGLSGKHVGDRVLLLIPSDLGYGDNGKPPTIPAKATLVFVVDIVSAMTAEETQAKVAKQQEEQRAAQQKVLSLTKKFESEGAAAIAAAKPMKASLPAGISTDNNQKEIPSLKATEDAKKAGNTKPILLLKGKGEAIAKDKTFFARVIYAFPGDDKPATTADQLAVVGGDDPEAVDFIGIKAGSRVLRTVVLGDKRTLVQIVDIMGVVDKSELK